MFECVVFFQYLLVFKRNVELPDNDLLWPVPERVHLESSRTYVADFLGENTFVKKLLGFSGYNYHTFFLHSPTFPVAFACVGYGAVQGIL